MIVCGTVTTYGVTNLVWSDEFNGSSSNVDLTKWSFDLGNSSSIAGGGWGNQEKETYTSRTNNAYVANGLLHIIALNDQGGANPYSSARLQTLGKFSATYGRVEFRAKLPANGPYWWPALWMLATNYSTGSDGINNTWPRCGEIDVMESKGSTPGKVQGTLHKDSSGNPGADSANGGTFNFPAGDGTTNFHTYILSWSSNSISFAVDNNAPYKTITSWSSSTGPFPAPFNHPFYIIMNLAVGGTYAGTSSVAVINATSTFPAEMDIDYVRVYEDFPSPPGVLSISPTNGCAAGGTSVTVSGTNFLNGATVSIGGVAASGVVFVNSNTLTAVTPANSAGAMNVAVTNPDTSSATLTNGFTYFGAPTFAGLDSVTPAIEGATLTWSAASGASPFSYDVWEGTESFGEDLLFTTNSLSVFVPLYPGSNSPITYFFVVQVVDGCGNNDGNLNELTGQPLLDPNKSQLSDGIPNGWKQQYGFDPFDSSVASADPDGDLLTNLQEYLLGTDPTDKSSPFHTISIERDGDDLLITWADAAGRTNVVEAASDVGGIYSNLSENIIVPGSGVGATNYLDAGAVTNSLFRYYRVRLVP
jgi:beta-glucanase (GH16 family)